MSTRTVRVRIPTGVEDGQRVRVPGQGVPGPAGGPRGDLLVDVRVRNHPLLRRAGDDLELDIPITIGEAFSGGKIQVPTPDGTVTLKMPPGTKSGTRFRLKGRGVARKGRPRGNFYVIAQIQLPEKPNADIEKAIEELEKGYQQDIRANIKL